MKQAVIPGIGVPQRLPDSFLKLDGEVTFSDASGQKLLTHLTKRGPQFHQTVDRDNQTNATDASAEVGRDLNEGCGARRIPQ